MKREWIVVKFYADIPAGTIGKELKNWVDPAGVGWVRLLLGENLSGKKLKKVFPKNCLLIKNE